jgi:hypothetical protein
MLFMAKGKEPHPVIDSVSSAAITTTWCGIICNIRFMGKGPEILS